MSAAAILDRAAASGIQLFVREGRLACRPSPETLSADLRDALREYRADLIDLLSPPARPAPEIPTKGKCYKCGHPVHWIGPAEGLVNWLGQPVHLRCSMSRPEPSDPEPQPEPEPQPDFDELDEAATRAMRRDIVTVVQDLATEGKRVGQIRRVFGLKSDEVWGILRGHYDEE